MKFDSDFVPKLAKKARLRFDRHSKRYMIVYPERGLVLNESAAAIVKMCDGTWTVGKIVHCLVRDSEPSSADRIIEDVHELLESLAKKGLLEP